jgi:hypothetical protein
LRNHQVVEPGRCLVAVADPDSDLAAHAAARAVALVVREVRRVVRAVDVAGLRDDAAALAREAMKAAQESLGLRRARDEAEVVPEHHDRVEDAERLVDVVDRAQADVAHAAPVAYLDGARRDVDADYVLPALLQVEADPAAAATDVEHASADESHRLPIQTVPPSKGGEIHRWTSSRFDEAVVAFHDLGYVTSVERGQEHLPVAVLAGLHAISDSTVGSPRRRGGRSSRQVQSCGSLSSRKRRKRVPCRRRFPCTLS